MTQENIEKMREIAQKSLDACSTEIGYTAGCHHFVDLWARDSLFACFGDIKSDSSRKTIETFITHQRKDGLIPYRIRRSKISLLKYLGRPEILKTPVADFRSYQSGTTVYDGGVMTILTFFKYVKENNDVEFAKQHIDKIVKAIDFYLTRFGNELISEGYLAEWADAVLKRGNVLFTNVLYLKALKDFTQQISEIKPDFPIESYKERYNVLHARFIKDFWNGQYLNDWVYKGKTYNYLSAYQNLLAVIWELVDQSQAKSIVEQITKRNLRELGVASTTPKYPFWLIPAQNYLAGVPDYHNGIMWLQPWVTYIKALYKLQNIELADIEINKLAGVIIENKLISENYEHNFKPINRLFYKSETPFAWSSGIVLWMLDEFAK